MIWLRKFLLYILPETAITSEKLKSKYQQQDQKDFILQMHFTLPLIVISYLGHYFFFDLALDLQPVSLWRTYRFSMAGAALSIWLFYRYYHWFHFIPVRLPFLLYSIAVCYLQTRTIIWYPGVPYLYSFLFMTAAAFCLRLNSVYTVIYISLMFLVQASSFWEAGLRPHDIYSGFTVSLTLGLVVSSIRYFQIQVFLSGESLSHEQNKRYEQSQQFTQTVKSFLPKKISKRLDASMHLSGISIQDAVYDVLKPRRKHIACLSCDIRGYTEKSKDIEYIGSSVIPLANQESDIVEKHSGIPRKIGDLLFCYFDDEFQAVNVGNSLMTAMQICLHELEHNSDTDSSLEVYKQILLGGGEAYVGNIGGRESAIEITAMGTPVNFLCRLETVVKSKKMREYIPRDHIILTKEFKETAEAIFPKMEFQPVDLKDHNMTIKDFESVTVFYLMQATEEIYEYVQGRQMTHANSDSSHGSDRRSRPTLPSS